MLRSLQAALWSSVLVTVFGGSVCPPRGDIYPWLCMTVPHTDNRLVTVATCQGEFCLDETDNNTLRRIPPRMLLNRVVITDVSTDHPVGIPPDWLHLSRTREIELRDSKLSNDLLVHEDFAGQHDYLTSLVISNGSLTGRLCGNCHGGSSAKQDTLPPEDTQVIPVPGFRHLSSLKSLDLSLNSINHVSADTFPSSMKNLHVLILAYNVIEMLEDQTFAMLSSLKMLNISHNAIRNVSRNIFAKPENSLKTLDLSWNRISVIPEDLFESMTQLADIRLQRNQLHTLNPAAWTPLNGRVQLVDLRDNFLVCNCQVLSVPQSLVSKGKVLGWCSAPWRLEKKNFKAAMALLNCTITI